MTPRIDSEIRHRLLAKGRRLDFKDILRKVKYALNSFAFHVSRFIMLCILCSDSVIVSERIDERYSRKSDLRIILSMFKIHLVVTWPLN